MQDENISDKVFEGIGKEVVKGGLIATIEGVRLSFPLLSFPPSMLKR